MLHHDQQVIDEIAHFANKVFAAILTRLSGRFHDLGRFFNDLGAYFFDAASK